MSTQLPEELVDLLVSEATEGLEPGAISSLDELLGEHPQDVRDSFEHAAAVAHLAMLDGAPVAQRGAMPADARARLLGAVRAAGDDPLRMVAPAVEETLPAAHARRDAPTPPSAGSAGLVGWLTAAAIALAWGGSALLGPQGQADPGAGGITQVPVAQTPTTAEQRAALLAEAADAITVAWGESTEDFSQVSGDVVWSNARQEGYMRLAGMPANDPTRSQYQLWIVDPERDARPVDGGVFDVADAAGGEVIVPIDAKLDVLSPTVFAITVEQPGGVVVSDGPLVLIAGI